MPDQLQLQPSCVDNFELDSLRVEDALQRLDDRIPALVDSESVRLRDSLDRICFHDINSPIDVPGHANSAMDGFAINVEDLDSTDNQIFEIVGSAFAGKPYPETHRQGAAIKIMTGAVIPDGFNAVIMQEQCAEQNDATVIIGPDHRADENIRFAGEDIHRNSSVFSIGHKINAADLGVLASLGIANIEVFRKPVVAFFSTGDELTSIDKPLQKGQIYDSNRYTLFGLLKKLPVDILDMGVIKDDPEAIRNALSEASTKADLILTTGGVSVGAADFIKTVLESIGNIEFWKIAIKPGRPLTYGCIKKAMFLGLPGNPVAVMVTFDQFVRPVIEKLSGQGMQPKRLVKAICEEKLHKKSGRRECQRGIASLSADGNWQVRRTGKQGSGILTSMSQANCFIVLNEENQGVDVGDLVDIQFFD
ncbi:MAG: molybdopterin molybdotransferase [Gammaproteobacteria bacterium]|jgi:molybdopterin molybdotransferase